MKYNPSLCVCVVCVFFLSCICVCMCVRTVYPHGSQPVLYIYIYICYVMLCYMFSFLYNSFIAGTHFFFYIFIKKTKRRKIKNSGFCINLELSVKKQRMCDTEAEKATLKNQFLTLFLSFLFLLPQSNQLFSFTFCDVTSLSNKNIWNFVNKNHLRVTVSV